MIEERGRQAEETNGGRMLARVPGSEEFMLEVSAEQESTHAQVAADLGWSH